MRRANPICTGTRYGGDYADQHAEEQRRREGGTDRRGSLRKQDGKHPALILSSLSSFLSHFTVSMPIITLAVCHSYCCLAEEGESAQVALAVQLHLLAHLLQHLQHVLDRQVAGHHRGPLQQAGRLPISPLSYLFTSENWHFGMGVADRNKLRPSIGMNRPPNITKI